MTSSTMTPSSSTPSTSMADSASLIHQRATLSSSPESYLIKDATAPSLLQTLPSAALANGGGLKGANGIDHNATSTSSTPAGHHSNNNNSNTTTTINNNASTGGGSKPKHLSQPYAIQSVSTEDLPALFGAASLRRSNSTMADSSLSGSHRHRSNNNRHHQHHNDHYSSYDEGHQQQQQQQKQQPHSNQHQHQQHPLSQHRHPARSRNVSSSTLSTASSTSAASELEDQLNGYQQQFLQEQQQQHHQQPLAIQGKKLHGLLSLPLQATSTSLPANVSSSSAAAGFSSMSVGRSRSESTRKMLRRRPSDQVLEAGAGGSSGGDRRGSSTLIDTMDLSAGSKSLSMDPHHPPRERARTGEPRATPRASTTGLDGIKSGGVVASPMHDRRPSSWDIMDMISIDRMKKWMVCFCVVNFDLEKGQDSNTFDVGDTVFNFRIRSATAGRAATGPTIDAGFLYGYVFFRQRQDPSIRRGYFQKSVVLLSQHPFIGLFSKIVSVLGPAYFEVGKPMLESAFHNIASWMPPVADGRLIELPFMGTVYQTQIAQPHKPQLLETAPFEISTFSPETDILSSVPMNGGLFKHFQDVVPDLWLCWELMTLAEPIMLIGTSPEVCSESVASLVELINPIPYCGDYRPYFTIQDTDFKSFCNKSLPPTSSIVLGVTNPFFVKTLEHWPHIIKIGKPKSSRRPNSIYVNGGGGITAALNGSTTTTATTTMTKQMSTGHGSPKMMPSMMGSSKLNHLQMNSGNNGPASAGLVNSSGTQSSIGGSSGNGNSNGGGSTGGRSRLKPSSLDFVQGLVSKRKGVVAKDSNLLCMMAEATMTNHPTSPVYLLDNILRRHFANLTEKFLVPLNKYFGTLVPSTISPNWTTLEYVEIAPFNQEQFLKFLSKNPPQMSFKTGPFKSQSEVCQGFYKEFLRCGNFATWLRNRTMEAQSMLVKTAAVTKRAAAAGNGP